MEIGFFKCVWGIFNSLDWMLKYIILKLKYFFYFIDIRKVVFIYDIINIGV